MVVLNRHIANLKNISDEEFLDMDKTTVKIIDILKRILKPGGFNIGINIGKVAGAGVHGHIHTHIVPRWIGDTNFMPIFSNTKVISQSLEQLYTHIKKNMPSTK